MGGPGGHLGAGQKVSVLKVAVFPCCSGAGHTGTQGDCPCRSVLKIVHITYVGVIVCSRQYSYVPRIIACSVHC